jgi:hypothetical protein
MAGQGRAGHGMAGQGMVGQSRAGRGAAEGASGWRAFRYGFQGKVYERVFSRWGGAGQGQGH